LGSPQVIRAGNVVASSDVVNAQLETVGQGEVSDAATRSWLQRVLTRAMTVW
jgi:flagellar L-ring protein precursor FlgH